MLEATVVSRRTSDAPNACSRSWFSSSSEPVNRSPETIGTKMTERAMSVPGTTPTPDPSSSARVLKTTGASVSRIRSAGPPGVGTAGATWSRFPCSYSYR